MRYVVSRDLENDFYVGKPAPFYFLNNSVKMNWF